MEKLFLLCIRAMVIATFWSGVLVVYLFTEFLWLILILLCLVIDIALFNTLPDKIAGTLCCITSFFAGIMFYKQIKKL